MIPIQITDYSQFDKPPYLLQQFIGTDIQNFVSIWNSIFEKFEAAAFTFINGMSIALATGNMLDVWGLRLGLSRYGRLDASYRTLLQIQAFINGGDGTAEELIAAMRVLFNVSKAYYSVPTPGVAQINQNGGLGIYVYNDLIDNAGNLIVTDTNDQLELQQEDASSQTILAEIVPSGVGLLVNYTG